MRRRNINSQKEEGKHFFLFFFLGKYRLYIRVNDL